jgi:hypothetical protein
MALCHHRDFLHERVLLPKSIDQPAFHPSWLRGISVSANLNSHAQHGFSTAEILGYSPKPNDRFGSKNGCGGGSTGTSAIHQIADDFGAPRKSAEVDHLRCFLHVHAMSAYLSTLAMRPI